MNEITFGNDTSVGSDSGTKNAQLVAAQVRVTALEQQLAAAQDRILELEAQLREMVTMAKEAQTKEETAKLIRELTDALRVSNNAHEAMRQQLAEAQARSAALEMDVRRP